MFQRTTGTIEKAYPKGPELIAMSQVVKFQHFKKI